MHATEQVDADMQPVNTGTKQAKSEQVSGQQGMFRSCVLPGIKQNGRAEDGQEKQVEWCKCERQQSPGDQAGRILPVVTLSVQGLHSE